MTKDVRDAPVLDQSGDLLLDRCESSIRRQNIGSVTLLSEGLV